MIQHHHNKPKLAWIIVYWFFVANASSDKQTWTNLKDQNDMTKLSTIHLFCLDTLQKSLQHRGLPVKLEEVLSFFTEHLRRLLLTVLRSPLMITYVIFYFCFNNLLFILKRSRRLFKVLKKCKTFYMLYSCLFLLTLSKHFHWKNKYFLNFMRIWYTVNIFFNFKLRIADRSWSRILI